jgi:hypothetical protein
MARTKRQQKLEKRRQRDVQREIDRRLAAGERVLVLRGPSSKTRGGQISLGEPVDSESDFAKRLARARAFLQGRGGDEPGS